jgi:chloramphenicol 3-O-phosphotransferase
LDVEQKDPRTAIFVISGTQGAGKTTVSRLLAERFERGAHIPADTLQKMIVSGRAWPSASLTNANSPDVQGEAGDQLRLRLHNACVIAKSFRGAGFTAVIDDIIFDGRLEQLRRELSGAPFYFVMLAPDIETVRDRERQRGTELWREWEWLTEAILVSPRVGLWLDTSAQTPAQTVDEIMRRAWDEAVVRRPTVAAGAPA